MCIELNRNNFIFYHTHTYSTQYESVTNFRACNVYASHKNVRPTDAWPTGPIIEYMTAVEQFTTVLQKRLDTRTMVRKVPKLPMFCTGDTNREGNVKVKVLWQCGLIID